MHTTSPRSLYEDLGIRRVVNARGNVTVLGGSVVSPAVQAAMDEANDRFVDMAELLEKSGAFIARLLGAEAALVTSGCFAALVQGAAAIMAGSDPARIAQLPDTTGMRDEFLLQKAMRYRYDRAVTVPGGTLVEVGTDKGTTVEQLEAAIGPRTAGILYFAREEGANGTLRLPEVIRVAKQRGITTLVDAAAEIYPLERMTWLAGQSGIDLVCFGAKYFGSMQSTGVLCGRRDLVEAAFRHGFIGYETYENRAIGRGYKVDRQEIAATVVALREWFAADHQARLAQQEQRMLTIARALEGLPYVTAEPTWPRQGPWMQLRVSLAPEAGQTAADVERKLREGTPSVWVRVDGDVINVVVHTLEDGEDRIVGERMREVLGG
ncbi:MAG: aminotransferase class V-fold PLP-dependent enzyme [Armatimonadota bacterium]|nr:aminotransferase class V-fold PLP-dependent enzyme [Armatimonadota bacterium]